MLQNIATFFRLIFFTNVPIFFTNVGFVNYFSSILVLHFFWNVGQHFWRPSPSARQAPLPPALVTCAGLATATWWSTCRWPWPPASSRTAATGAAHTHDTQDGAGVGTGRHKQGEVGDASTGAAEQLGATQSTQGAGRGREEKEGVWKSRVWLLYGSLCTVVGFIVPEDGNPFLYGVCAYHTL
jgi:hypothetical protein